MRCLLFMHISITPRRPSTKHSMMHSHQCFHSLARSLASAKGIFHFFRSASRYREYLRPYGCASRPWDAWTPKERGRGKPTILGLEGHPKDSVRRDTTVSSCDRHSRKSARYVRVPERKRRTIPRSSCVDWPARARRISSVMSPNGGVGTACRHSLFSG